MRLYDVQRECGAEDVTIKALVRGSAEGMSVQVAECPFDGEVEIRVHRGIEDWECPMCGTHHEEDDVLKEGDD